MSWATGLMVYLVIWWTILFAVLPFGVKRVENPGRGQDHGAPERPQILRKAIITSIVAAVLWIGFYVLHQADIFDFRHWADQY
jgi:predicted secreted protein